MDNINITEQDKVRIDKIANIVSKLPEIEQEKIYYMIKGMELASDAINSAS